MQKVNVVIEVELAEVDHVLPTDPAFFRDGEHEQILLAALKADPASYDAFIRTVVIGSVAALATGREIDALAHMNCSYTAGLAVLESLFSQLPSTSRQHFEQAQREGWLSEGTLSIHDTIQASPIRLTVEYPPRPLPSSPPLLSHPKKTKT